MSRQKVNQQKLKRSLSAKLGHLTRKLNAGIISQSSFSAFKGHLTRSLNNATKSAPSAKNVSKQKLPDKSSFKKSVRKTPPKSGKKKPRKNDGASKGGRSSRPIRKSKLRKRKSKNAARTSRKSVLTKRLDKLSVFKIESGKTPVKKLGFLTFESTGISREIVKEIIERAKLESDNPLLQVRVKGEDKDGSGESEYSTILFPIYLEQLSKQATNTRFADPQEDEDMVDAILMEVDTLAEYYNLIVTSYEFFIMWK